MKPNPLAVSHQAVAWSCISLEDGALSLIFLGYKYPARSLPHLKLFFFNFKRSHNKYRIFEMYT